MLPSGVAIKSKAKSKEEIPSELQSLYVERDGAFVLDVDGAVDKGELDEFRNTNVALIKERDDLKGGGSSGVKSAQVQAVVAERDSLNARLTAIQIDQGVTTVASKKGLRPTAIPDFTAQNSRGDGFCGCRSNSYTARLHSHQLR